MLLHDVILIEICIISLLNLKVYLSLQLKCHQNEILTTVFSVTKVMEKKMALRSRRQRRVNSKYVSDDFESIFTERRQVSTEYCGCKHSAAACVRLNMCTHSTSKCPVKRAMLPVVVMDTVEP